MPERKKMIRAPAKIMYGLRFKSNCTICGRIIPSDRTICNRCHRNILKTKLIKAKQAKLMEIKRKRLL